MGINRRDWLRTAFLGGTFLTLSPLDIWAKEFTGVSTSIDDETIRLCFNENPFGVSPFALDAMQKSLIDSSKYSFASAGILIEKLAKQQGLEKDNYFISAGSSFILELVTRFAAIQGGNIVYPDPTFSIFKSIAEYLGMNLTAIPLTDSKKIDLNGMFAAVKNDTRLVYICNPNNPTGDLLSRKELTSFLDKLPKNCLVLLDEAYIEFASEASLSDKINEYPNLIISRTFSKLYGMAGARLGYAVAHPDTIKELKSLTSWGGGEVSSVTSAAGLAALEDATFIEKVIKNNKEAKKFTEDQFAKSGIPFISSETNFLYFSLENYKNDYFQKLKDAKIMGGRTYEENGKWTRISIGTLEQMQFYFRSISV